MTETTVPELLSTAAATWADHEAVVDGDIRWSFAELDARVREASASLIAKGVSPGDRIAIWAPNTAEWVVTLLALHSVGAALVPINTRYKGAEAQFILSSSGTSMLFTTQGFLGNDYVSMIQDHRSDLEALREIVVMKGAPVQATSSWADFLDAGSDVEPDAVEQRRAAVTGDTISDVMYTSGTTGSPKGVVCTHSQVVRAFREWASLVGLGLDDRYLIINPFFHSFGYKAGIVACLATGATMIPQAAFDVPQAMELIENEKASMLPGPPTLYQTIMHHPDFDPAKLASLRLAVTGAASIPVSLIEEMRNTLGFETVLSAYGLTEACGIATVSRAGDPAEIVANYSGRAIDGVEVAVIDPDGNELPSGEVGEIVVRGYNVMLEYLDDPERTAETIDADGWLHTGDVGSLNPDGYLDITDRVKDMFIVGGFNAYPAEIESLLTAHEQIAQVAVVGVPDERQGEVGYAFVIPTAGAKLDAETVIGWARQNMANYKVPRHVDITSDLPLNASGKVLKFELRDRAMDALAAGTLQAGTLQAGTLPSKNPQPGTESP